ncbi:SDR family oxidoreductase, partial [Actinosynnema sp.]|uniref:SDR family oxidoreductase n=1 Tax=Actinosynnema sp. TaxID=1872144 RepID=UPI003F834132
NAGVTRDRYLFRMSLQEWNDVLTTHMTGAFLLSRAVQAPMVDAGYGRLLFISSTSALGNRGQVNYSGAKAGVQGMARTLSLELGRFGVTVNCVAPGFVETDMTRKVAETSGRSWEQVTQRAVDRSAVGRTGQPSDIAAAVAFLASDRASFVTGQTLYVAGRPTV